METLFIFKTWMAHHIQDVWLIFDDLKNRIFNSINVFTSECFRFIQQNFGSSIIFWSAISKASDCNRIQSSDVNKNVPWTIFTNEMKSLLFFEQLWLWLIKERLGFSLCEIYERWVCNTMYFNLKFLKRICNILVFYWRT